MFSSEVNSITYTMSKIMARPLLICKNWPRMASVMTLGAGSSGDRLNCVSIAAKKAAGIRRVKTLEPQISYIRSRSINSKNICD